MTTEKKKINFVLHYHVGRNEDFQDVKKAYPNWESYNAEKHDISGATEKDVYPYERKGRYEWVYTIVPISKDAEKDFDDDSDDFDEKGRLYEENTWIKRLTF